MSSLTHEFQHKLPVTKERLFAALTEPQALRRWFAEYVEIQPRPGGTLRFWGKHTYGTPQREQASQQLLRYEPPHALAYTWTLHDRPSEVTLLVDADPELTNGSILKGRHEFAQAPAIGRAKEMIDDLWRLQIGNLQMYLEGGQGILLPDYSDPNPRIRVAIMIDAPRENVFRALIQPELLNKWIAAAAEVDPRVGGHYRLGWKHQHNGVSFDGGPTRILDMVENEKLVIDWPDWRGDTSVPQQKITWLLESIGRQTRVTLIHDDFTRTVDLSDYPFGWSFFLDCLKRVAEGKEVPAHEHNCG